MDEESHKLLAAVIKQTVVSTVVNLDTKSNLYFNKRMCSKTVQQHTAVS